MLTWSNTSFVWNRSACSWKRCISSGPCTPITSAGQLSTSVVVISWPPWAMPVTSTGSRFARGVDRRGVARRAGAEDEQAGVLGAAVVMAGSGMWSARDSCRRVRPIWGRLPVTARQSMVTIRSL